VVEREGQFSRHAGVLCFILVNKAFVIDFNTENTQVFITAVKSFYALCQAPLKVEVLEPSWTQSSMTGAE
jgi:hypothetical protein